MYRTYRFNGYATAFLETHGHFHGCARRASCAKILYFLTRLILYLQVDPALAVDDEVVYFRYSRTDSHDGLSINLFCVGMKCLIFL